MAAGSAFAADDALIDKLVEKGTITSDEGRSLKAADSRDPAVPQPQKGATYGGINLQVGGFIEAASIYRSRDDVADVGSTFSGIPFASNSRYNVDELRGTARQSRLSLLAQGDYSPTTHLAAYYEMDFLGAGPPSNSNESNSFLMRIRHLYATTDWDNLGLHLLMGQSWSLATLNNMGITPRNEWIPLTIDAQYAVGFTWARQWQARIVKDWDKTYWAALSIENPQTVLGGSGPSPASALYSFPGNVQLNNGGGAYSINSIPDVIGKFAYESPWGHYEVYDLARTFEWTNLNGNGHSLTVANSVGAGAIVPVVRGFADFSLSGLYGRGVGRYGSAQLADATFESNGGIVPLKGHQVLAGLTLHPNRAWDVYFNAGEEKDDKAASTGTIGYGNSGLNISNCALAATAAGACSANINSVDQLVAGFWWTFYQGSIGKMKFGAQYSYTTVSTYAGLNGAATIAPTTNDNMFFTSFRYYPF